MLSVAKHSSHEPDTPSQLNGGGSGGVRLGRGGVTAGEVTDPLQFVERGVLEAALEGGANRFPGHAAVDSDS